MRKKITVLTIVAGILCLPLISSAQEFPEFFDSEDRDLMQSMLHRPMEEDTLAPKVKKGTVSADYNRPGMTIVHLTSKDSKYARYTVQLFDSLPIPFKYDDNNVSLYELQYDLKDTLLAKVRGFEVSGGFFKNMFSKKQPEFFYEDLLGNALAEGLTDLKVPNQIYANWFQLDRSNYKMSSSLMEKRAAYNSKDDEIAIAQAMARGVSAVLDEGEKLVNSSYVLLMHYHGVMNETEYKAWQAQQTVKVQSNVDKGKGFVGQASGLLFKLDFDDRVKAAVYNEMWPQDDEPELVRKLRVEAFDNARFPLRFVGKVTTDIEVWEKAAGNLLKAGGLKDAYQGTQTKTKEELLLEFADLGLQKVLENFETLYEGFQTKASVHSTKPIVSKVGRKESIRPDQRYFVWEYREDKSGVTFARRKGVVRATNRIYDNVERGLSPDALAVCDTCVTKFYQVAGKKLDAGMLMQQRNDLGISATLGYAYGGIGGPFLRVEYNTAQLLGRFMKKSLLGMKLFVGGGLDFKQYDQGLIAQFGTEQGKGPKGQSFFNIHGGLAKEFYFLRNYSAGVEFGFGYEGATWKDSNISLGTLMLLPGFTVSRNLLHNLQVVLGGKWVVTEAFSPGGSTKGGADITFTDGIRWGDIYDGGWFKRRTGPQISLGIRYNY